MKLKSVLEPDYDEPLFPTKFGTNDLGKGKGPPRTEDDDEAAA